MTESAQTSPDQQAESAAPGTVHVHPMAALSEASFDNEIHRNRRLVLANDIHTLHQIVADREAQLADLKQRLAAYEPPESVEKKKGTK